MRSFRLFIPITHIECNLAFHGLLKTAYNREIHLQPLYAIIHVPSLRFSVKSKRMLKEKHSIIFTRAREEKRERKVAKKQMTFKINKKDSTTIFWFKTNSRKIKKIYFTLIKLTQNDSLTKWKLLKLNTLYFAKVHQITRTIIFMFKFHTYFSPVIKHITWLMQNIITVTSFFFVSI